MRSRPRVVGVAIISLAATPLMLTGSCGGRVLLEERTEDAQASRDANPWLTDAPSLSELDSSPPEIGVDDFVKGWMKSPWAGNCALYQPATDAQLAAVPPFDWVPCASGRADCMQLAPDWPATDYHQLIQTSERATSASSVEVMTSRQYSAYHDEYVIWDSVRGIEAVWRSDGDATDCLHWLGEIAR